MKNRILIIGQAPPAVKQKLPYDTTLLYEMLAWVGISKMDAQNFFDFEALVSEFTGFDEKGGHKKPTTEKKFEHFRNVLDNKIFLSKKIILLGNESRDYLMPTMLKYGVEGKYLFLPHPSKRNYNLIMKDKKELITKLLKEFL